MFVETDSDKNNICNRYYALIIPHAIQRTFLEAFLIAFQETSSKELPETFFKALLSAFPVLFPIGVSQSIPQTLPYSLTPNPSYPIQGSTDIH